MRTLALAIACLVLTGCAALRSGERTVSIRWIEVPDAASAELLCAVKYPAIHAARSSVNGCYWWEPGACVIVAANVPDNPDDSANSAKFGVLGHEAYHCFKGKFHEAAR
jgi:hypothetical protein